MARLARFRGPDQMGNRFDPVKKLGSALGMPRLTGTGMGRAEASQRFIGAVQQAMTVPTYNLPNIETVRIHYDGPLNDASIEGSFGASINPLGSNQNSPPPGASSVESTMAEPGKLQTYALIMAIGWHLEPEPLQFEAKVNAFTTPSTGVRQPVSPDDFTIADLTITLGLTGSQTLTPAVLEWGWWAEKAFYHMTRAYNLVWQWGQQTTIVNDSLRFTAYTPSSGQEGGASSSEVDINAFIRETNNYYFDQLGSNLIALPIDRTRIGNMTLNGTPALSVFRPTRTYETVGATYGGMGLRSFLRGNTEFRKLTVPFLLKPGVPIGLRADVKNDDDQKLMQQWLSASQLLNGVVPGDFTSFRNINSGGGVVGTNQIGNEPSLDNPVAPQPITTITDRVIFKGGGFKITVALKGFELTDDQASMLTDSSFLAQLTSSCGCQCPSV
jgi:hypothetical protein